MPPVSERTPALSIGLAVRNEPHAVRRCVESVLDQDFRDLELVICDNVSDDDTVPALEAYARDDRRISLSVNEANIGSHENMNRVLELARGTLFRWISADDWLEPGCLRTASRRSRAARTRSASRRRSRSTPRTRRRDTSCIGASSRRPRILPGASSACCGSSMPATRSTTRSTACIDASASWAPRGSVPRSGRTGFSVPSWRSRARSSISMSGSRTAPAPTRSPSIGPRSGGASIRIGRATADVPGSPLSRAVRAGAVGRPDARPAAPLPTGPSSLLGTRAEAQRTVARLRCVESNPAPMRRRGCRRSRRASALRRGAATPRASRDESRADRTSDRCCIRPSRQDHRG